MTGEAKGAFVLFGATGDLSTKLVLPALYRLEQRRLLDQPVVGVARSHLDDEAFRARARSALEDALGDTEAVALGRFLGRLSYLEGDYGDPGTFDALRERLGERAHDAVHYLAIPPGLFATVASGLASAGLASASRLVVEKPFGTDLASARALAGDLHARFPEEQIFRVDHFLGKDSVADLLVFRFANRIFEPVWNRDHVACVQLSFAETLLVGDRGSFYDPVGAIRDVVENHLFQVLAYLAMDPPSGSDEGAEQRERTRLLRSVRTAGRAEIVRGQYRGYRQVPGVDGDSRTETYAAMRLWIDNWRWHGVPFCLRTGKGLPTDALEAVVELRPAPPLPQVATRDGAASNRIRLRLQPERRITAEVLAKVPGRGRATRTVPLSVDLLGELGPSELAYERVLSDALAGSRARFTSMAAVEQAWRIVEDVLDLDDEPLAYDVGSWGPPAAARLAGPEGWRPFGSGDGRDRPDDPPPPGGRRAS